MPLPRLSVQRVIKIEASFTARDWDLYEPDSLFSATVAGAFNRELEAAVHAGLTKEQARKRVALSMTCGENIGAMDGEPFRFLDRVLDEIYGKDE